MADHQIRVKVDAHCSKFQYKDENDQDGEKKWIYPTKTVDWFIPDNPANRIGTLDIYFDTPDGTPFEFLHDHFTADRQNPVSRPEARVRRDLRKGDTYKYRVVTDRNGPNQCEDDPEIIIDGALLDRHLIGEKIGLFLLAGAGIGIAIWGLKRLFARAERE